MCGIAGFIGNDAESHHWVANLINSMLHRGPDHSGLWHSPDGRCSFGHSRLSVIDLSPDGNQPMKDPLTGNVITFNGEIYNYQNLRNQLSKEGEKFQSQTDTEVILALYRRYGVQCLRYLRGMFAFAIWDAKESKLFLARDRIGKKPLNYALTHNGIVFSSEINPLSKFPGVDVTMDHEALGLYLQLQYIPAPWSIYRGIRKLLPAHWALWDGRQISIEEYWNIDYRLKSTIHDEEEALEGLLEKLKEAVRLRMIADVPIGALLSGGVDSSVVVGLMSQLSGRPVKTFSIGFREEKYNELPYAQKVAQACGTVHHPEVIDGNNIKEVLPQIVLHYGEPFGDSSAIPSFHVCRVARREVTVVLNGDGGDETLGGYPRYLIPKVTMQAFGLFKQMVRPEWITGFGRFLGGNGFYERLRRKIAMDYLIPELRSSLFSASLWGEQDTNELLGTNENENNLKMWRRFCISRARGHSDNIIDELSWLDVNTYLPGALLTKMDIASMHCSLEARSPLLDHEVIEYCAALPPKFKVRKGEGKYLLRKLGKRFAPREVFERQKQGFAIPRSRWMREKLGEPLSEMAQNKGRIGEIFQPKVVNAAVNEFLNGNDRWDWPLWLLLIFVEWTKIR